MYDDSISFVQFFKDMSDVIDFAPIDWTLLLIIIGCIGWMLYQKRQRPAEVTEIAPDPNEDEEAVKQNPGDHAAVIRLILKTESIEQIDSVFSNYIDSSSHHPAYEIEVVAVHYLRKAQLLDGDERQEWYMGARWEGGHIARHGYTQKQFSKAMSDALKKYPELHEWSHDA